MAEQFLIKTTGGPYPGTRLVPEEIYPWPLPEILPMDPTKEYDGVYCKVSEGSATPYNNHQHVLRGAKYEWVVMGLC